MSDIEGSLGILEIRNKQYAFEEKKNFYYNISCNQSTNEFYFSALLIGFNIS